MFCVFLFLHYQPTPFTSSFFFECFIKPSTRIDVIKHARLIRRLAYPPPHHTAILPSFPRYPPKKYQDRHDRGVCVEAQ